MLDATIYHNPDCSKSRATLALLKQQELSLRVVHALDAPPDGPTLCALLRKLGMSPRELLRTGEEPYRQLGLDDFGLEDGALIAAMLQHPVLIQRPIVVVGDRARIGRPPESVLALL